MVRLLTKHGELQRVKLEHITLERQSAYQFQRGFPVFQSVLCPSTSLDAVNFMALDSRILLSLAVRTFSRHRPSFRP